LSGSGHAGIAKNTDGEGMAWTSGKIGGAVSFDGTDDYVVIPRTNSEFDFTNEIYTISMWVNIGATGTHRQFIDHGVNANNSWSLRLGTSNTVLHDQDGGVGLDSTTALSEGSWRHVVGLSNGTHRKIYLDGVEAKSGTALAITNNTSDVNIARRISSPYYFYPGKIDDVRIYNRALSAAEVAAIYNSAN
jgi:hypothetical protein